MQVILVYLFILLVITFCWIVMLYYIYGSTACPVRKLHIARQYMFYLLYYTESMDYIEEKLFGQIRQICEIG